MKKLILWGLMTLTSFAAAPEEPSTPRLFEANFSTLQFLEIDLSSKTGFSRDLVKDPIDPKVMALIIMTKSSTNVVLSESIQKELYARIQKTAVQSICWRGMNEFALIKELDAYQHVWEPFKKLSK